MSVDFNLLGSLIMPEDGDFAAEPGELAEGDIELALIGFDVDKELVFPDLATDRSGMKFGEVDAEIGEYTKRSVERARSV